MKAALLRFLHLFMAVLVLLSSTGYGLIEHSCQLRGKRTYSIRDSKPGCQLCARKAVSIAKTAAVTRTDCCKNETRYNKVNVTSSLSQWLVKFVQAITDVVGPGVATVFANLLTYLLSSSAQLAVVDYESPPPLAGRSLLSFVQTYLI